MGSNSGEYFEHSQYIMSKVVSSAHWVKEKVQYMVTYIYLQYLNVVQLSILSSNVLQLCVPSSIVICSSFGRVT